MRAVWLILALSTGSCLAQTPAVCPWLTSGTAAAALGGPVELNLHLESTSQGTCRFTRGSGMEEESIEVAISKVKPPSCPVGGAKLAGFGNEAVECESTNSSAFAVNAIAGRLRDVYFSVRITTPRAKSPIPPANDEPGNPDIVPSILQRVTEQVVGNLY